MHVGQCSMQSFKDSNAKPTAAAYKLDILSESVLHSCRSDRAFIRADGPVLTCVLWGGLVSKPTRVTCRPETPMAP